MSTGLFAFFASVPLLLIGLRRPARHAMAARVQHCAAGYGQRCITC
ncbi:hypothetical protein [Marinobacter psychrophilus]|nr:hypothetical protein [Marinobacter psychrophilus]MBQ0843572.1 hypothetical protein [Marinobacter psychrophilus]